MAKKRRQPAALRKYWATHRKGRKRAAPRKRRRARKNWSNTGAIVAAPNPHRRHRRRKGYRMNARKRRRHSYRRNPAFLGLHLPPVRAVAFGVAGFAAPPLISGFLTTMAPSIMQTATSAGLIGKYAVKVGTVALASWLTHRFISARDGDAVMIGGGINIGMSLMNDFAPGFLPANPLSSYVPTRTGLRAYVPTRSGLRAVNSPLNPVLNNQRIYSPGIVGGGYGTTASESAIERYRRY